MDKWSQFRALLPNQGGEKLSFEEPVVREGQRIAQVDLEEIQVEISFWSSAVVCQVLGANPPFAIFEGFIKRIWGKLGIKRIARLNNGFTLVKFRDEVTRDLVLEVGVLHFDRKPVIVKPWSIDLDTLKAVKSVPLWVRLPGLGLQYWGTKCLSALMSMIGVPILVDKVTKDRSMMQFARVLVEIELSEDLPKSVQFLNEKGQLMEQLLEFEWLPTQCRGCKVYGHTERMCNKKPSEIWRQKSRIGEDEARQEISKQPDPESSVVNQNCTPDTKSNDRGNSYWITPKRVGGHKKVVHRAKNTLTNSYSALQDKVMEVANLGLTSTSALLETKLRGDKIKNMMQSFFRGWSYFTGSVSKGRLLLIWQQSLVSVDVLKETDQLLHVCVNGLRTNKLFCVTFVYGRNSIEERVALWRDLSSLCFPATPWLLAGDFNAVFEGADRIGGRAISSLELSYAQNWRALGLVDELRARGSHFTWTNKQANEDRIYSRLDRVFKNEDWLDIFPQSEAVFNWELLSDHCYCIIKPEATMNYGVKLFRFFNMWTDHEKFKITVMHSWCKPIHGSGLVRICKKLSKLQFVLRNFNKHIMGDVAQNYVLAKEKFQDAQLSLQSNPHSVDLQRLEAAVGDKFKYHARIYESFLRQKSKVDWLRYGDDNTAYFHACLKQRRASNCINSVMTESGQSIEKFDDVVDHFVTHFQKIMGSKSMASRSIQSSCFSLGHKLTLDQQDPTYLILMNGKVQGEFRGRRGLRQGDPISPLLFVLAMEYCTRLLRQASMDKGFHFHPNCKHLKIFNLCFADDLVYFGGVAQKETQQMLEGLRFSEGNFPLKYLGVPLRTTRWKAGDCAIIIKKIQLKLHTWASHHLSFAGRAQLINSVLLSIRSFWMSIFILPKSVTKEVDRLCRNFLWGVKDSNSQRSKMHFTAWDQVCLPK
ncbi:uncharacterized protein LOC133824440 [Humulus lupulus]|uniref:uncharacterized protein LOC133824440 n=1 Tax=Humulus lupulus TaxID=3486 RepID=UPI002B401A79|nr:uncharacterized protein LOC133824440 [Humulus lupulus]